MRVISISLDSKICDNKSPVFKRMKDYATLTDEMHIICFTTDKQLPELIDGNLFVYPTNSRTQLNQIFDAYKIGKKIIKKRNFGKNDSIITTQDPFESGVAGYLLKLKFGLRLNIQDHGNVFESNYWWKKSIFNFLRYPLGKLMIKKSDSIRTVSLREKKYIEKTMNYNHEKIINFPIFIDWEKISAYEPKFNLKQKYPGFDFYMLTLCRLEKVKNIPLLLDSFSKIIKEFPKTLLIIVGGGSQKNSISNIIRHKNLQKNVVMENWTDDPISYYKTADLFILTSFSEGWGLTIMEAAASKCPVVMTNTGCSNEFIFNEKNGWIVNINDANELFKAIKDAILHKQKRIIFSQAAFTNLANMPNKEQTLAKLKKSWEIALNQ